MRTQGHRRLRAQSGVFKWLLSLKNIVKGIASTMNKKVQLTLMFVAKLLQTVNRQLVLNCTLGAPLHQLKFLLTFRKPGGISNNISRVQLKYCKKSKFLLKKTSFYFLKMFSCNFHIDFLQILVILFQHETDSFHFVFHSIFLLKGSQWHFLSSMYSVLIHI